MIYFYTPNNFRLLFNKRILLYLLIFKLTIVSGQQKDTLLIWKNNHSLTRKDFWSKDLFHKNNPDALSILELSLVVGYDSNKKPIFTVIPIFNRSKSFISKYDFSLLDHEQQHFNILEIFTRKIRKSFDQLNKLENSSTNHYFNLFYSYQDSIANHQHMYDSITDYSRNKRQQKIWKLSIIKRLKDLEEYSVKNYYNLDN